MARATGKSFFLFFLLVLTRVQETIVTFSLVSVFFYCFSPRGRTPKERAGETARLALAGQARRQWLEHVLFASDGIL